MYQIYRKVAKGLYHRIIVTDDLEYAITYTLNSTNCHLEIRA